MIPLSVTAFDRRLIAGGFEWNGTVFKVFDRAAVLHPCHSGPLLTLLNPGKSLAPWSIIIPLNGLPVSMGQSSSLVGRRLEVGDVVLELEGKGTSLCLSDRRRPSASKALFHDLDRLPLPERTRSLLTLADPTGAGLEQSVTKQVSKGLGRLVTKLFSGDTDRCGYQNQVARLSGLGPGLTPTGDDVLVGLAATAEEFTRVGWIPPHGFREFVHCLCELPISKTTREAHEMIANAASGAFPEPLIELVISLTGGHATYQTITAQVTRLARDGAYSGQDMLAGALALAYEKKTRKGAGL